MASVRSLSFQSADAAAWGADVVAAGAASFVSGVLFGQPTSAKAERIARVTERGSTPGKILLTERRRPSSPKCDDRVGSAGMGDAIPGALAAGGARLAGDHEQRAIAHPSIAGLGVDLGPARLEAVDDARDRRDQAGERDVGLGIERRLRAQRRERAGDRDQLLGPFPRQTIS